MSVSRRHLTVAIAAALLVLAAFGAVAFGWSNDAVAQTRDALVRQEQYQCLKKQFPGVSTVDGKTAFDPDSGRNFAYEGNAWIDTKTLAPICSATPALVGRALYKCLKKQFPGVSTVDGKTAFDPDSGRNFAREGDSWIDTKTLESICPKVPATRTATGPAAPATPQVGMVI